MTPEQFCYWLQGRAELKPDEPLSAEEWKTVVDHLQLVFKKETPLRGSTIVDALMSQRQQSLGTINKEMPQCSSICSSIANPLQESANCVSSQPQLGRYS